MIMVKGGCVWREYVCERVCSKGVGEAELNGIKFLYVGAGRPLRGGIHQNSTPPTRARPEEAAARVAGPRVAACVSGRQGQSGRENNTRRPDLMGEK